MADVRLEIGGHDYHISCRDGDESNLIALGAQVNERVQRAKSVVRNATVAEQLVMAAILLADELQENRSGGAAPDMLAPELAEVVAARMEVLADKLENLARHA
ncbi:MAG: cell division protein ZapA [Sphingomonadales bacterium]|nr:cell division protein ZapA [Sphingomonadales bacterium]